MKACDYNTLYFERTAIVAGSQMMNILRGTRVIVFGLGGVGSWCAEALARSAVGEITLVDPDTVAPSNINRQLPALAATIGSPKAEVLAERFAQINPDGVFTPCVSSYNSATARSFGIETYDYVVDAIDSLADKADLILRCTAPATAPRAAFYASMGAARKLDPALISATEFWKVQGCPLARALRTRFRRAASFPQRKFTCVYSPESIPQSGDAAANGTFAHITMTFGTRLAALILADIYRRTRSAHCRDTSSCVK